MDISTLHKGGGGKKAWEEGAKFIIKINQITTNY